LEDVVEQHRLDIGPPDNISEEAYSKRNCTIGAEQKRELNYFRCGEGNGYK
jgi:hypothetical protein